MHYLQLLVTAMLVVIATPSAIADGDGEGQPDTLEVTCARHPFGNSHAKQMAISNRTSFVVKPGSLLVVEASDGDRWVGPIANGIQRQPPDRPGAFLVIIPGQQKDAGDFTCKATVTAPGRWKQ